MREFMREEPKCKPTQMEGTSWADKLRPLSSHVASLLYSFLPRFLSQKNENETHIKGWSTQ